MAQQFDDAVAAFGGSDWVYTWPLESPDVHRKTEGDIGGATDREGRGQKHRK